MDHKLIVKRDNRYFVNIDITADEWKAMLINEKIFHNAIIANGIILVRRARASGHFKGYHEKILPQ